MQSRSWGEGAGLGEGAWSGHWEGSRTRLAPVTFGISLVAKALPEGEELGFLSP